VNGDVVSYSGGTIERARERCAGNCNLVFQTKSVEKLPALTTEFLDRNVAGLNTAERALMSQPGLMGRLWFGQGLIYDEIYQLLQDIDEETSRDNVRLNV